MIAANDSFDGPVATVSASPGKPSFLQPHVWVYILILALPFSPYLNLSGFPLSVAYVLAGLATVLWISQALASQRRLIFLPRELVPMTAFIATIAAMSLARSEDIRASLIMGVQIAVYYITFILVANVIDTEQKSYQAVHFALLGLFLSSFLGVIQALFGFVSPEVIIQVFFSGPFAEVRLGSRALQRLGSFGPQGPGVLYRDFSLEGISRLFRAFGMFEGPVVYGFFSAYLAPFALAFRVVPVRHAPGLRRRGGWAACVTMAAVFLSWVRSAWLTVIFGLTFVLVFRRARKISLLSKRWIVWGLLVVVALSSLIMLACTLPESSVSRMILSAVGGKNAASSNAGRIATAAFAMDYIRHSPMLGVGFGNYPYAASGGRVDSSIATSITAHNTFLELGVELGLPGVLIFLWLLSVIFGGACELIQQPMGTYWHSLGVALAVSWVSYLIISMFGGNIVHPKWMTYWWLLAGLQAAARRALGQSRRAREGWGNDV